MTAAPPNPGRGGDGDDYDPFDEIRKMQDEMDSIFGRFFSGAQPEEGSSAGGRIPSIETSDASVDIIPFKEVIYVIVELSGYKKEDIKVKVSKYQVEVRAKSDRSSFYRVLDLPSEVLEDKTNATFKNGVLELKLVRKHPRSTSNPGVSIH